MFVDEFVQKSDRFVVQLIHADENLSNYHVFRMVVYQCEGTSSTVSLLVHPKALPAFLDAMRNAVEEFESYMPVSEA